MSNLLELITGALGDIDVSAAVGGEAENLTNIIKKLNELARNEPEALGNFVQSIAELEMPSFDFADDLIEQMGNIRDLIPADKGDVLGPINDALENIDSGLAAGPGEILEPLINAFRAINVLIHTDFSFGQSTDEGGGAAGGDGAPDATTSPATGLVSNNPDTQIDPARLQAFQAVLDELPEEPTIGNLLEWFNNTIDVGRGDVVAQSLRSIPFLDDIREPLDTVLSWKALAAGDLQTQINNTLQTLSQAIANNAHGWLEAQLAKLADLIGIVDITSLQSVVLQIIEQLEALKAHIDDGTLDDAALTIIENEIAALMAQRDALVQQFLDEVKTELEERLAILEVIPELLEEKMTALLLLLQPPATPFRSDNFPPAMPEPAAFAGLEGILEQYQTAFENLINALDISDITDAFSEPAQALEEAVDQIEQAITMVTLDITNRLNQVRDAIAALDISGLTDNAEDAIEQYTGQIIGALSGAFTPVRETIETIAEQITAAVSAFNPAALVATIEDGIDTVGAVLQGPEVTAALETLEKLKSIAERLDRVSFTPVADKVIDQIDDMTAAVQGLGNNLDDPLKSLLQGALDVLPDDLQPVTDPLIEGLEDLIAAGPIGLLEAVKDVPQEITATLTSFEPGELIGDSLSEPFQNIISEIQEFEPGQLLDPINTEIENFKNRVRENANPASLFNPLIELHEQVLKDLEGFKPGEIIEPINEALTNAFQRIAEVIPVEGLFDEIESVINDMQRILGADGVADAIIQLIQTFREYLTPFVDAAESVSERIQEWLDEALAVLDGIDVTVLQTAFTDLTETIDATRSEALQTVYDSTLEPVVTALNDTLQPGALMTALVRSQANLRSVLGGVEAGLSARIDTILVNVDPTAPDFSSVFNSYNRVVTVLNNTRQRLVDTLASWDDTFHRAEGVLASYQRIPASPQDLKDWIIEALDKQLIKPLQSIFEKFTPTALLLDAFIGPLVELVEALRDTVNGILAAPMAIVDVGNSLKQIQDRLGEINLDFIAESIDDIYDEIKTQFRGLDPRGLKNTVNQAFENIIGMIDINQVVPADALNQTDAELDNALEALRQLDPQILITEVVQPKFEEILAPFISALDLTPALSTLNECLGRVDDDLKIEMDRVNQSYQQFINAVP